MYLYNLGKYFTYIAKKNYNKPALIYSENKIVPYKILNELSERIACYLLNLDIKTYNVIGIFNTKTVESFALMIACLKIGAIYVNFDITSPVERLKKMIKRCKPKCLFYDQINFKDKANQLNLKTIFIKNILKNKISKNDLFELNQRKEKVCSDNPAYIMFTSGSTGFPKGAVMTHQNLLNFIYWIKERYKITTFDRLTNVNPMYFDNSVFDFYGALFNGAALIPLDIETTKNPKIFIKKIDQAGATIWFSVPSLLVFLLTTKSITKDNFKKMRIISFGGEGFPKTKLKELYELYNDRAKIINVYGPTECTCICSAYDISENDFHDMMKLAPLGKIAPNFNYLIINKNEKGEGELALSGPQLGIGYYNDPERTEKAFINHPEHPYINQKVYKTGDLVRERNDGLLEIIGRVDNQIKYMGYRIELEEIEAGFNSLKYINETCVIYKKFNNNLGQIIAYISVNTEIDIKYIQEDIKKILPPYMIPKQIKILDHLPKNKNGKIDRKKLSQLPELAI